MLPMLAPAKCAQCQRLNSNPQSHRDDLLALVDQPGPAHGDIQRSLSGRAW
jgi:hypothetical protein